MALHQEMAQWFDANPNVERYSPFGVMRRKLILTKSVAARLTIGCLTSEMQGVNEDNRLMDANGWITSLGDWVS